MSREDASSPPPIATGFVKLYRSISGSSILFAPIAARWLWVIMLANADGDGIVRASPRGLAHLANLPQEDCDAALKLFLSPDADSRSPESEGRRIEDVVGGWRIVNFAKYRDLRSGKQIAEARRKADYRAKQRKGRR